MKQVKNWILRLSIRQKLVFYSYLVITPILLLISTLLLFHNYRSAVQLEEDQCIQNVQNVSDSISVVQKNIMEMGTYISINEEIKKILTVEDPEELNRDARLWFNHAPNLCAAQPLRIRQYIDGNYTLSITGKKMESA